MKRQLYNSLRWPIYIFNLVDTCTLYNQICYALSKICLAAQYLVVDISLCNNDISIIRSDISLRNNDILMIRNDISLSCSDISLSVNDISLSDSDISLGEDNISLGANDKSRRTQRNIATAKTIVSRYLGRYIVSREISFKYRRYIAIIAIFVDYRLHYFCTIL